MIKLSVLRKFALEVRRRNITTKEQYNVFATRYFARLAKLHVTGMEELPVWEDTKDVHVYRIVPEKNENENEKTILASPAGLGSRPDSKGISRSELMTISTDALAIEHSIICEIASLRADPQAYRQKIETLRRYYVDPFEKFLIPGGVVLSSREGWSAYENCLEELASTPPLPPLQYSSAVSLAAREGLLPENASIPPRDLCLRFGSFDESTGSAVAQSLCMNQWLPQYIVLHLIVDDYYNSRGNRKNLLSTEYTSIGVCFHGMRCNIVFTSNYTPLAVLPVDITPPRIPTYFDYQLNLHTPHFKPMPLETMQDIMNNDALSSPPDQSEDAFTTVTEIDGESVTIACVQPSGPEVHVHQHEYIVYLAYNVGHLIASLTSEEEGVGIMDRGCFLQAHNQMAVIHTHFPASGVYKLIVSVDVSNSGVYTQVLEYTIRVTCDPTPVRRFPMTYLQTQNCYVYTPQMADIHIPPGQFVPFVVEALQTETLYGIAVLAGNELYYLERSTALPSLWCGYINLKKGPCKISANIDNTCFEVFGFDAE